MYSDFSDYVLSKLPSSILSEWGTRRNNFTRPFMLVSVCFHGTGKLKSHKSPGIDPVPAELIKAGDRTIRYEIHNLIISIWNKEELPEEWKKSIIVLTRSR
jgi:hypothetical protein